MIAEIRERDVKEGKKRGVGLDDCDSAEEALEVQHMALRKISQLAKSLQRFVDEEEEYLAVWEKNEILPVVLKKYSERFPIDDVPKRRKLSSGPGGLKRQREDWAMM